MMNLAHRVKAAYEEGSYLLDGAVGGDLVAASNSLKTVKLYTTDSLQFTGELKGHRDAVKDLRFSKVSNGSMAMTVGERSVVRWDTRSMKGEPLKVPIHGDVNSGDISCDGAMMAFGNGNDVVVYDVRNLSSPLINLDGFHTDLITRVRFHESSPSILTTGSEDGLIIVIDPKAGNEDDATTWIFNVNNPISTLTYNGSNIIATTTTESVFMGDLNTGSTVLTQERPDEWLYVIGPVQDKMMWGVKGEENESRYGEILTAPIGESVSPESWPVIKGGHEDLVRFAHYHPVNSTLYTGGEDGFLCAWSATESHSGFSTESRVPASKNTELDVEFTGDCTVTASPLVSHKSRKSTTKSRRQAPY
eukprot:TRINITY_DN12409_c4_g1_i1.p1 TRINITY_DN12409_c4_g1~~TRINITY_DN12409_c4_g1_i1.p1  ORF type:complete len:362 (+),score=62.05 TRINITY_DN12409_c4_g1_i1:78-1163(+)